MPLDGRIAKLERALGRADGPCEECGQAGDPFEGRDQAEVLAEAKREALERPRVEEAYAHALPCRACGRPVVTVFEVVYEDRRK